MISVYEINSEQAILFFKQIMHCLEQDLGRDTTGVITRYCFLNMQESQKSMHIFQILGHYLSLKARQTSDPEDLSCSFDFLRDGTPGRVFDE